MSQRQRRAAVLEAPRGPVRIVSEDCPAPLEGEVLLRMEACGICHSDVFVAGLEKLPLCPVTLGHEGIGRVEATGPCVTNFAVGDRAGVTFLASSCGVCELCRSGRERFCARQKNSGYSVHGALADWAVVPAQQLARIPDAIDATQAAPLCCAGWTAYGAVRETAATAGQLVGIFGMGGLGHLALQYARHRGLRTAAIDLSPEKLQLATDLGADITADATTASRTLQKEHGGLDAAVVLTAAPAAIDQAFRSVKRTGSVILVGLSGNTYALPIVDTVLKGIQVRGSFLGTRQDLEDVFALAAAGAVKPHITAYPLDEAPVLIAQLREGTLLGRAVVVF